MTTESSSDRKSYRTRNVDRTSAILAYKGTVAPRYDSENLAEVLFRLNASIWKDVLPWCLCNTMFAAALYYVNLKFPIAATDKAHSFMSLAVSYLLVTRTKICIDRYMKQRSSLSDLIRACKELVSHSICFTRFKNTDESGKNWRCSVAKRTISLLKVIISVLQYPSTKENVWEIHDLPTEVKEALLLAVGKSNQRSPLVLTLFLRTVIASHSRKLTNPLDVSQELCLLDMTNDILAAYTKIVTYINTPYPFPLVQMTRTILIIYIFTLPLALANDITSPVPYVLLTFIITYGFIGMELICVEIDDPFGKDPNDFDVKAIAKVSFHSALDVIKHRTSLTIISPSYSQTVYEDIIVFIADSDGKEAEEVVRNSIGTKLDDIIKNAVEHHDKFSTGEWGIISSPTEEEEKSSIHRVVNTIMDSSALIKKLQSNMIVKQKMVKFDENESDQKYQLKGTSLSEQERHNQHTNYTPNFMDAGARENEMRSIDDAFTFNLKNDVATQSVRRLNIENEISFSSSNETDTFSQNISSRAAAPRSLSRGESRFGVSTSKIMSSTTYKMKQRRSPGGTNSEDPLLQQEADGSMPSAFETRVIEEDDLSHSSSEGIIHSEDFLPHIT